VNTDKEYTLYLPANKTWPEIGEDMVEEGAGACMWVAGEKEVAVGSIGGFFTANLSSPRLQRFPSCHVHVRANSEQAHSPSCRDRGDKMMYRLPALTIPLQELFPP
jgi:hypothetical protein